MNEVRFEVFMAVIMKNVVFWDVMLFGSCKNRCFGGTLVLKEPHASQKMAFFIMNEGCGIPSSLFNIYSDSLLMKKILNSPGSKIREGKIRNFAVDL
jgi:hypothetical protein